MVAQASLVALLLVLFRVGNGGLSFGNKGTTRRQRILREALWSAAVFCRFLSEAPLRTTAMPAYLWRYTGSN
jgi:hypothetical protein